jgi:hypothetical protein
MARLVAEVPGRLGAHPLEVESLAHDRERNLQLLVRGEEAVDAPEPLRDRGHGARQLLDVEHVVDAPMLRDRAAQRLGQRLERILRDDAEPHPVEPRRGANHPCGVLRQNRGGEDGIQHETSV